MRTLEYWFVEESSKCNYFKTGWSLFQEEAEQASECSEKACVFRIGLKCILNNSEEQRSESMIDDMYRNMWLNKIQARLQAEQVGIQ